MLITNIGRLVTMVPAPGREGVLGVLEGAALHIEGDRIMEIGLVTDVPAAEDVINVAGKVVMPGLIDCHTHMVHSGSRHREMKLRSEGKTYQDIARAGGGIMSTVTATRAAEGVDLFREAWGRADEALALGTTTLEIKSGYGLDVATELKIIEVIGRLKREHPLRLIATFMGAHVIPSDSKRRRADYVQLVINDMLPAVKRTGICQACDVFVDELAFTVDEARAICQAAKHLGFAIRLHVDQFSDTCGAQLASELGAKNADHLDHVSDKGIRAMVERSVVGVLLPGAAFFTGGRHYPPARKMIDMGLTVAIASDYNPGTNPSLNLWLAATIAITQMGLTCDEALRGITIHAARALGVENECGTIEVGKRADLIILDAPDEYFPLYRYGRSTVEQVIISGKVVSPASS